MKEKNKKWGGGGEGGESVRACGEIYLEAGFYSEGSSQSCGEPEFVLQEFDASRVICYSSGPLSSELHSQPHHKDLWKLWSIFIGF